jgi:hypothetical protein
MGGREMSITVAKNERGAWCVYIDGQFISDHATHTAARVAARNHYIAAVRSIEPPDIWEAGR